MSRGPIGILYEHPEWFRPLFAELDRRGLPYQPILADRICYDPAAQSVPYGLVVNRMSPSAYLRGHGGAIFAAQDYLAHLDRLGVPTINGLAAFSLELSKARQLDLLASLGLRAPLTRVVNHPAQIPLAAAELVFPLIIKPNVGGSGALMRQFDAAATLDQAVADHELDAVFGVDGTGLVQEYHPPRGGSIVRVEALDGQFLYAIRIHNDPSQGFNLCPADICQVPDSQSQLPIAGAAQPAATPSTAPATPAASATALVLQPSSAAAFDNCPIDVAAVPARKIEAEQPPTWVQEAALRLFATAGLDLGGVEYLQSERDGELYFYDINALSNFVTDAPNLIGFDPFVNLVDLIERRWQSSTPVTGAAIS